MNDFWEWMREMDYGKYPCISDYNGIEIGDYIHPKQQAIIGYMMEYIDHLLLNGVKFIDDEPWFEIKSSEERYLWLVKKIEEVGK
jgi:hypothetical protein